MLVLMGNDIGPESTPHYIAAYFLLIIGAFFNAHIFGTIAMIVSQFNRKAQRIQEKIDLSNTSMKNMKLPEELQDRISEFMLSTSNNLDN